VSMADQHHRRRGLGAIGLLWFVACSAQEAPNYPAPTTGPAGYPSPAQPNYFSEPGKAPLSGFPVPLPLDGELLLLDREEQLIESVLAGDPAVPLAVGDRCTIICKSLTSMRQSATHICQLAADRCEAAQARVRKAEERTKDACPACSTPT
jgi:hypothetical protein